MQPAYWDQPSAAPAARSRVIYQGRANNARGRCETETAGNPQKAMADVEKF
jgi:hypothetical protein